MGFICKSCDVIAGTEEFPTGSTYADRLFRSKTLLTKCAQALISCNVGWQLDTNKSTSVTDYTDIPDKSGNYTFPGLFFVNTISGCKLFMAYFGEDCRYYGIKDFSGNDVVKFYYGTFHSGLCMSMIPAGSNSVFGDPTTTTFIPSDATRITGSYYFRTDGTSHEYGCHAYNPTSGWSYGYKILATPYCISVFGGHNDNGGGIGLACPIYACGRIFGEINHGETHPNARYGTLLLRYSTNSYESWAYVFSYTFTLMGNNVPLPWYSQSSSLQASPINSSQNTCGAISRSDGSWVNGNGIIHTSDNNYEYNVALFTMNIVSLDRNYTFENTNSKIRWSPIGMMSCCSYNTILSQIDIINDDCFKGILDTDLFRACNGSIPRGSIFDNGKFIVPESDVGWLIGWDPSNDPI